MHDVFPDQTGASPSAAVGHIDSKTVSPVADPERQNTINKQTGKPNCETFKQPFKLKEVATSACISSMPGDPWWVSARISDDTIAEQLPRSRGLRGTLDSSPMVSSWIYRSLVRG